LYFKYVVNGALRRVSRPDGTSFWDMSNEDYLEDFDMFRQVLDVPNVFGENGQKQIDHGSTAYADLIAPAAQREKDASEQPAFQSVDPYPVTPANLARSTHAPTQAKNVAALDPVAVSQNIAESIDNQLDLSSKKKRLPTKETPQEADVVETRVADTFDKDTNPPPVPLGADESLSNDPAVRDLLTEFDDAEYSELAESGVDDPDISRLNALQPVGNSAEARLIRGLQAHAKKLGKGARMADVVASLKAEIAAVKAARESSSSISEEPTPPPPAAAGAAAPSSKGKEEADTGKREQFDSAQAAPAEMSEKSRLDSLLKKAQGEQGYRALSEEETRELNRLGAKQVRGELSDTSFEKAMKTAPAYTPESEKDAKRAALLQAVRLC
jgi:hypothetical protein